MNKRLISILAAAGVALIALTGCTQEAPKTNKEILKERVEEGKVAMGEDLATIDPKLFTKTLTDAIEKEAGQRPLIDCGTEKIPLQAGSKVLCHLDDGGEIYEVEASVGNVATLEDFGVSFRVAGEPGILKGSSVGPKEDGDLPSEIGAKVE